MSSDPLSVNHRPGGHCRPALEKGRAQLRDCLFHPGPSTQTSQTQALSLGCEMTDWSGTNQFRRKGQGERESEETPPPKAD